MPKAKTTRAPAPAATVGDALAELLELTAELVADGVRSPATLDMQRQRSTRAT